MATSTDIFPIVYLNGAYIPARRARVSAFDRGFLVADGIFETFHVYRGAPVGLQAHLDRLHASAEFMKLKLPWKMAELGAIIARTLTRNGLNSESRDEAAIRLTLSRGEGPRSQPSIFIYVRRLAANHLEKRTLGLALYQLPWAGRGDPSLAQHKTLSYLASSLGQIWLGENASSPRAEGLFVALDGAVLEGTSSNVFIVEGDTLVTPPVETGILGGISRRIILEMAPGLGLTTQEENFDVERLRRAGEVFITSSTLHLAPVTALDGLPLADGDERPVVRRLQTAFHDRVCAEVDAYWADSEEP